MKLPDGSVELNQIVQYFYCLQIGFRPRSAIWKINNRAFLALFPQKTIYSRIWACEKELRSTIEPLLLLNLKLKWNSKCVAFPSWTIWQICICCFILYFISGPLLVPENLAGRRCVYFIGFHYSRNNSPPTFKKGEAKYRSILYQKPIKLLLGSDTPTLLSNIKSWLTCCSDTSTNSPIQQLFCQTSNHI